MTNLGADVWNLSLLNTQQRTIIQQALARCTFDFNLLRPGLLAGNQWSQPGKTQIPVTFRDLSTFGQALAHDTDGHELGVHVIRGQDSAEAALGLYWFDNRVEIEQTLVNNPLLAMEVFHAEGAHATDFNYMWPKGWRPVVYGYYHASGPDEHGWFEGPYYTTVGEAFMGGFIRAFTDIPVSLQGFVHVTTDTIAAQIRSLLMPVTPPDDIDWSQVSDAEFEAEYLRRFGDWAGIDIALTHRKGQVWTRGWRD